MKIFLRSRSQRTCKMGRGVLCCKNTTHTAPNSNGEAMESRTLLKHRRAHRLKLLTMEFIIENSTFDPNTKCWNWNLSFDGRGYAVYGSAGIRVGRFAWELEKGRLLENHACHTCDNPSCVNPDHIFDGTHQINLLDKKLKRRERMFGPDVYYQNGAL